MELRTSERKHTKIKLAVQGSSGTGKTLSSLKIAYGLTGDWSKIAVIDTENGSADLYAHLGAYKVVPLTAPFSPEQYCQAITLCEKAEIEVIIIDSISHSWEYLLSCHAAMTGNSFVNWNKITPRYNEFIQKILQSNTHTICTMRTKQDYILNEKNGKLIPEKAGMKAIMREGADYEFTIVISMSLQHQAKVTKDRTGIFNQTGEFIPSVETGQAILKWCNDEPKIIEMNPQIQNHYGNSIAINA